MKKFTGYQHGINLGGWLSQCDHTKERYETFITEADIARIRAIGGEISRRATTKKMGSVISRRPSTGPANMV